MTVPMQFTLKILIKPEQTFTYINLPFEVPSGAGRIDVTYRYDSAIGSDPTLVGGNTIDMGIVDPRGAQFLTSGFRGWSGSARRAFYIAEDSATPGYLPGPIQEGTWFICLGAYKVAPTGCNCEVEIKLTRSTRAEPPTWQPLLPVRTTTPHPRHLNNWYKGELHCHTVNSDGDSTCQEVVQIAESLGLDFLAITDHNNRSHLQELVRLQTNLTLIPGYEVTTYYGHWNIWGDGAWIDFRVQSPDDLRRAIREAQDQGYLVSCNHPRPYGPDWAFPEVEGYSCVEVWNGPWQLFNEVCLAFWEARLNKGQRLVAVGGSDFHFSRQDHIAKLAHPTTYIYCPEEPSAANLLRSLRAGHAFVTEAPDGPQLDLRAGAAMMGDMVVSNTPVAYSLTIEGGVGAESQICTSKGVIARFPITQESQTVKGEIDPGSRAYIHAQLVDPSTRHCRAVSNPIYLSSGTA